MDESLERKSVNMNQEELGTPAGGSTSTKGSNQDSFDQGPEHKMSTVAEEKNSVLAQVQRYQMRHRMKKVGEESDSGKTLFVFRFFPPLRLYGIIPTKLKTFHVELDSDSDGEEEDGYQVFGRMTMKAQSQAFYEVNVQQKENGPKTFSSNPLPKFLQKKSILHQVQPQRNKYSSR